VDTRQSKIPFDSVGPPIFVGIIVHLVENFLICHFARNWLAHRADIEIVIEIFQCGPPDSIVGMNVKKKIAISRTQFADRGLRAICAV
jgi:hypothetical protein